MHKAITSTIWKKILNRIPEEKADTFNVQLLAMVELENMKLPFELKRKVMEDLVEKAINLQLKLKYKRMVERAQKEPYVTLSQATIQMMEEEFNKKQEIEEVFECYLNKLEEGMELTEKEIAEIEQEIKDMDEIQPINGLDNFEDFEENEGYNFDFDDEPPF
ncbi:hypothetical protein [Persephonella sp. IF05-L8]|uniref:hypothetical protein n=1 Tax=Persephonella sp. IF05-L8 TaxID=1158338 RepID=UPI0004964C4E